MFLENKFLLQNYWGRMVRMACLRDSNSICEIERMKERILELEVMEEEVISWSVLLSPK